MEEVKEMLVWEVTWYRAMNDEVAPLRGQGGEKNITQQEKYVLRQGNVRQGEGKKKKDTCMALLKHGSKFFDILPMHRWKSMFHLS